MKNKSMGHYLHPVRKSIMANGGRQPLIPVVGSGLNGGNVPVVTAGHVKGNLQRKP